MNISRSKLAVAVILTLALLVGAVGFSPELQGRAQRFSYIVTKRLRVTADSTFLGGISQTGDMTITGDLTVTDDTTLGDAAGDTVAVTGDVVVTGWRDGATGYDYFQTIEGNVTGVGSGAKTYGLYIDLERTVANTNGNIDDAGMKLRYKNSADSRVLGIVQTGADIEAKNDDGHNTGTLRGASITAVTDEGGDTDTQVALRAHNEIASTATITTVQVADFELNRKSTNEPTVEYGINLRNTSSAGTGADVGYRLESSFGAGGATANADWVYGIDLDPADIVTADIRLSNGETIANTTDGTVNIGGMVSIAGVRDATSGYDYFTTIEGDLAGTLNGAKTYGLYIDVERTTANAHGNIDDAGAKIRAKTSAGDYVAGIVMNGIDAEAKVDDNAGITTIRGAQLTGDTDTGSRVSNVYGARIYVEQEGVITTTMNVLDVELKRKYATDATNEWGVNIRNTSELGGGADVALRIESSGSGAAANDDWAYGIDMNSADLATADIRLQNGETIDNATDTAIVIGGFIAADIGGTLDITGGDTITPVATWQPITSSCTGSCDTDNSTAIADGPIEGALLIICNRDAQDIVIKDGANTLLSGDITLTGGEHDCLGLLWNGSDWASWFNN